VFLCRFAEYVGLPENGGKVGEFEQANIRAESNCGAGSGEQIPVCAIKGAN
jgi:hypothetical protein